MNNSIAITYSAPTAIEKPWPNAPSAGRHPTVPSFVNEKIGMLIKWNVQGILLRLNR